MTAVIVLTKAPAAGRSKTRLCPPCTPAQAAALAEAALRDTLDAVASSEASRRIVALDGCPGEWVPDGFDLVPQRGNGLDERIASAFVDCGEPALLIGMDTPQVSAPLLDSSMAALAGPGVDAVLGEASDGGWWALGLQRPDPAAVLGVPMSVGYTGKAQLLRLEKLGLRCHSLPVLRDVDFVEDARAVASQAPGSRFAAVVRQVLDHSDG